jgi:hypothetical protein
MSLSAVSTNPKAAIGQSQAALQQPSTNHYRDEIAQLVDLILSEYLQTPDTTGFPEKMKKHYDARNPVAVKSRTELAEYRTFPYPKLMTCLPHGASLEDQFDFHVSIIGSIYIKFMRFDMPSKESAQSGWKTRQLAFFSSESPIGPNSPIDQSSLKEKERIRLIFSLVIYENLFPTEDRTFYIVQNLLFRMPANKTDLHKYLISQISDEATRVAVAAEHTKRIMAAASAAATPSSAKDGKKPE